MRTLIVYFSKFGNTGRLAEAMAETLGRTGQIRTVNMDQLATSHFEAAELIVMGSPTHAFTLPQAVRSVLDAQPLSILSGKSVAAFDTTVKLWPLRHLRASPKLLEYLKRLGGTPVARPKTFYVRTKNPHKSGDIDLLLAGELDRARKWADGLVDQVGT